MCKAIFVNRFFYPDQSATSQILSDLLFNVESQIKSEIHVVTSRNTYQNDERLKAFEKHKNINIHRIWTTRFGRSNLLGRAIDYFSFYMSTFVVLLWLAKKHDLIVVKTDPPIISYVPYVVSKIKKTYLINWIQDLFPEVASGLNMIKSDSLSYGLMKKIKNISLKSADMNIAIGHKMQDLLVEEGVSKDKTTVIDNWNVNAAPERIARDDNYLIDEWGLRNKFIVSYSGNFGRAHEYNIIKELVEHYKHDESLVILFIGGGKYYDDIKEQVEKSSINNVLFKPYQDIDKLNFSLSLADLHIISLRPELEGLILPSKFYGLASIGAPVLYIGDKQGDISRTIKKNTCGYTFEADEKENIVQLIDQLKTGENNTRQVTENLLNLYQAEYKPEVAYAKWLNILHRYDHEG